VYSNSVFMPGDSTGESEKLHKPVITGLARSGVLFGILLCRNNQATVLPATNSVIAIIATYILLAFTMPFTSDDIMPFLDRKNQTPELRRSEEIRGLILAPASRSGKLGPVISQ